jgi:hypothetical protein
MNPTGLHALNAIFNSGTALIKKHVKQSWVISVPSPPFKRVSLVIHWMPWQYFPLQ